MRVFLSISKRERRFNPRLSFHVDAVRRSQAVEHDRASIGPPLAPVGAQRLPARLRAREALRLARVPSMHYRDKLGAAEG